MFNKIYLVITEVTIWSKLSIELLDADKYKLCYIHRSLFLLAGILYKN